MACGNVVGPSPKPTSPPKLPVVTDFALGPALCNDASLGDQDTRAPATDLPIQGESLDSIAEYFNHVFSYRWSTEFANHSVPYEEIQFLGRARVPIVSGDANTHDPIEAASVRLSELELVTVVEINGETRAYPLSLLIFVAGELVNDSLGGVPIAVTW